MTTTREDDDARATTLDALRRACAAGDARATRIGFHAYARWFYGARGRTLAPSERRDVFEREDGGASLVELARGARSRGAIAWLRRVGAADDDDEGDDAREDDDFEARLRDESRRESREAATAWETYARAEREWSATGPLGDEAHRARVWAAASARRRREDGREGAARARDDATRGRRTRRARRDAEDSARRAEDSARRRTRGDAARATRATTTIDGYRRAWRRLERARAEKIPARTMRAKDFPFVDDATMSRAAGFRDWLTSDVAGGDARARLREEMVRWHPDKFSKYLELAREEDLDEIKERVNATSRAVRDAFKASSAAT